jgi:hypothetical protein
VNNAGAGRWPTFLVIGAARAGTTSVHGLLRQHPAVLVPQIKEPNYFALRAMGINLDALPEAQRAPWGHAVTDAARYRALFAAPAPTDDAGASETVNEGGDAGGHRLGSDPHEAPGARPDPRAFGECSPVYLAVPGTAEQIHAAVPEVRLVAILRDPVDRAISHHAHNLRSGVEDEAEFGAALAADAARGDHSNYVRQGFYAMLLDPYFRRFPREQILLLDQRELGENAVGFMNRVFEHIGVSGGVPLRIPEPALATSPEVVPPTVRQRLAAEYRADTRRLVSELGFEPARAWSTY